MSRWILGQKKKLSINSIRKIVAELPRWKKTLHVTGGTVHFEPRSWKERWLTMPWDPFNYGEYTDNEGPERGTLWLTSDGFEIHVLDHQETMGIQWVPDA